MFGRRGRRVRRRCPQRPDSEPSELRPACLAERAAGRTGVDYLPPSFLGVWGAFFLGDFFLVTFLDFLGGVSCAKVRATQPRASERPSINVIRFFIRIPPGASATYQASGKSITDFAWAVMCRAIKVGSSERRAGGKRGQVCRIGSGGNAAMLVRLRFG